MSSGFHRLGANAGKVIGWSNQREIMRPPTSPLGSVGQISVAVRALDANPVPEENRAILSEPDTFSPGPPQMTREQARMSGYTGDTCSNCGSTRMKISGHCYVCESCGTTTGCS